MAYMFDLKEIKEYTPAALWSKASAGFATRKRPRRRGRSTQGGGMPPPVPAGHRWYMTVLDVLLVLMLLAGAGWLGYVLTTPDPRISVQLIADGVTTSYYVFPTDVASFLDDCGISLAENDIVSRPMTDALTDGMEITVTRAFPVAVKSQAGVQLVHVIDGTVGDALRAAEVAFDVNDEISYEAFEDLVPGMQIIHTDVVTEYDTTYKTLEYKEEVIRDDSVYNDTKPVLIQEGKDGTRQLTYRIVYKNGVRVSREVVDQVVITPSTPQITKVGTKIHYQTSLSGEFRIYRKPPTAGKDGWIEMKMDYITAYATGNRTATGGRPKLGTIAVNPYYIPYYSEIYVPGYGYGTALDTGEFRKYTRADGSPVNQLDLFMNTDKEANRWGRKRNVTVLVRKK